MGEIAPIPALIEVNPHSHGNFDTDLIIRELKAKKAEISVTVNSYRHATVTLAVTG